MFPDSRREFSAADRCRRRIEALKPQHRPDPLFYAAMILFDSVVEIVAARTAIDLPKASRSVPNMAFRSAVFVAQLATEIGNSSALLFMEVIDVGNLAVFGNSDDQQPSLVVGMGECGDGLNDLVDEFTSSECWTCPCLPEGTCFDRAFDLQP